MRDGEWPLLIGGQGEASLRTREGKDTNSRESGLRREQPGQRTQTGTELMSGEQCVSRPEATRPGADRQVGSHCNAIHFQRKGDTG